MRREEGEVVSFDVPKLHSMHYTDKILFTSLNCAFVELFCGHLNCSNPG